MIYNQDLGNSVPVQDMSSDDLQSLWQQVHQNLLNLFEFAARVLQIVQTVDMETQRI